MQLAKRPAMSPSRQISVTPFSARLITLSLLSNRQARHDRLTPKKGNEVERMNVPVAAGFSPTLVPAVGFPRCALAIRSAGASPCSPRSSLVWVKDRGSAPKTCLLVFIDNLRHLQHDRDSVYTVLYNSNIYHDGEPTLW